MTLPRIGVSLVFRTFQVNNPSVLKIVGKIKPETLEDLRNFCRESVELMKPDVSNYARGRYRVWLFHECNLKTGEITKGFHSDRLERFCQFVYPSSNIGLLTFGGKLGEVTSTGLIKPHRDHTYAKPIARTVNLGSCIFFYNGIHYQLNDGDIIQFNCKLEHGVSKILSKERFSINLWQLNQDKGFKPLV